MCWGVEREREMAGGKASEKVMEKIRIKGGCVFLTKLGGLDADLSPPIEILCMTPPRLGAAGQAIA